MSPKSIRTTLSMSVVVGALGVFLGAGSATAADRNPAAHGHAPGYAPPPGIYDYAPGYGPAPCFGPNCGLPGGHPGSDYFKPGNGDHGNDGGNGG
jgi:hypothetical protein